MDYMNKFTVFMTANYQMHSDLWIHNWEHSLSPLPWERSTNKIIVKWCSEKKKKYSIWILRQKFYQQEFKFFVFIFNTKFIYNEKIDLKHENL